MVCAYFIYFATTLQSQIDSFDLVQLDGAEMLGHHIVVERENLPGIVVASVNVNEDALRAMVKRLLSRVHAGMIKYEIMTRD